MDCQRIFGRRLRDAGRCRDRCVLTVLAAPEPIEFNRDIRPILSDRCYQCHGPDAAKRKADLRLDQEASAKADRDGGRAIVPGDLEGQRALPADHGRGCRRADAAGEVRASRSAPPRSRSSAAGSTRGRSGSRTGRSFRRQRPAVPAVADRERVRNPIDAFILARLEREGLAPSPEAERGILIRRVTLDLTGLPPTADEIDAFERDASPDAYEKVVDRLLASPRLGERMAIRWLNAARYADTNGYQTDGPRFMWRWRDWVIDAFNRNMPFDQFTIEQLAGDLLPGATLDQKIATGFNRNHRGNAEGGIIPEEYAVEYVVDRVDTTATVWLGLTLACARCHNHKFDPITQEEFYQLFAFFNNVPEKGRAIKYGNSPPLIKAPTRGQQADSSQASSSRAEAQLELECARLLESQRAPTIDGPRQAALGSSSRSSSPAACDWSTRRTDLVAQAGPAGRASPTAAFVDVGDVAGFGFFDKFTLGAWIKPDGAKRRHDPLADGRRAAGRGLQRRARAGQGPGQPGQALARRRDPRRDRSASSRPTSGRTSPSPTTARASPRASRSIVDGKLAPLAVLLDELNQTFLTKEPLRIGAGGGPEQPVRGRASTSSSIYCRGPRRRRHRDPGDERVDRRRSLAIPAATANARRRRESSADVSWRRVPRTRSGQLDARIRRAARRARRVRRADPHDDGDGGDAGAARDARPDPRPVRPARRARSRRACRRAFPRGRATPVPTGWAWPAGWSIRPIR